jgi:type IV pilus assembly protein PilB
MGVEPYLVASALVGVISQRLIRKICPDCKRTAIHEILVVNNQLRKLISQKISSERLAELSVNLGMETMYANCVQLVLQGTTTIEEMVKVVYVQE